MGEIGFAVRVTGRVQGVSYRAWARAEALLLGLRGWVRNRGDGSVEALIAGPEAQVREMVLAMSEGPAAAEVTDVWTDPVDPASAPPGFVIRD